MSAAMARHRILGTLQAYRAVELVIVVAVVATIGTLQAVTGLQLMRNAAIAEAVLAVKPHQVQLMEDVALRGEWAPISSGGNWIPGAAGTTGPRRIASLRELEQAQAELARSEAAAVAAEGLGARYQGGSIYPGALIEGVPTTVISGPFLPAPTLLEFRPVVLASGSALAWVCSRQAGLEGAPAVAPAREPRAPHELLPSVCRSSR